MSFRARVPAPQRVLQAWRPRVVHPLTIHGALRQESDHVCCFDPDVLVCVRRLSGMLERRFMLRSVRVRMRVLRDGLLRWRRLLRRLHMRRRVLLEWLLRHRSGFLLRRMMPRQVDAPRPLRR